MSCNCNYRKTWREALESGNDIRIAIEFLHALKCHGVDFSKQSTKEPKKPDRGSLRKLP